MPITQGENGNASDFVETPSGAPDSGKVAKLDDSGHIVSGFLPTVGHGDESDGDITLDGTTNYNTFSSRAGDMLASRATSMRQRSRSIPARHSHRTATLFFAKTITGAGQLNTTATLEAEGKLCLATAAPVELEERAAHNRAPAP